MSSGKCCHLCRCRRCRSSCNRPSTFTVDAHVTVTVPETAADAPVIALFIQHSLVNKDSQVPLSAKRSGELLIVKCHSHFVLRDVSLTLSLILLLLHFHFQLQLMPSEINYSSFSLFLSEKRLHLMFRSLSQVTRKTGVRGNQ